MLQSHHGKPNAPTPFDQALDAVEGLPEDAQIELLDVVRRRLAERGRRRVIKEVTEAEAEFERGLAKPTSVDDLMSKIES